MWNDQFYATEPLRIKQWIRNINSYKHGRSLIGDRTIYVFNFKHLVHYHGDSSKDEAANSKAKSLPNRGE